MTDCIVVSPSVFWEHKVDQYIQYWQYGKSDDEEFKANMTRMGYEKGLVDELVDKYNEEFEEE